MRMGDKVEVMVPEDFDLVNCDGIPFRGLTGTVIARARSVVVPELLLVLFDRDICGLAPSIPVVQGSRYARCDHNFNGRMASESHLYTIMEGGIAPRKRNQRFFATVVLRPLAAAATSVFRPRNNDGRSTCFWCGAPTKSVPGISVNNYDICTRCGK